jgi:hypothetical protein
MYKLVDHSDPSSLAAAFRRRRFALFKSLVSLLPKPITILDLGGEQSFWEEMCLAGNPDYLITMLNVIPLEITYSNLNGIMGDAIDLHSFADQEFDLVFSNSVIEHLGSYQRQQCMAEETQRVGKHYFVQTPNRHFPLEPHFLVPFYQFLPFSLQVAMIQRFNLGWYKKIPEESDATQHVISHRLLTIREMHALFPTGTIFCERVLGLTKSFIAYGPRESM